MSFSITGGDADDRGPVGCVVRFILAGEAGDNAAAAAELHPDCLASINGDVKSPPGITGVALDEPLTVEGNVHVPARLNGPDGSDQRFVFVVRPVEDRWGVDLNESLKATFGGDPLEMMGDALREAVAPLGEAMEAMGNAMSSAFGGGSSSSENSGPSARRIAADDRLPSAGVALPESLTAHLTELDLRRRIQRSDPNDDFAPSTELSVRVLFDLDPSWTANACRGVTITEATAITGENLAPIDANPDLGSESYASWERERHEVYARFALAAPQKAFTGLKALAGNIRLSVVGGELLEIALGPIGDLLGKSIPLAAFDIELAFERDQDNNLIMRSPSGWPDRISEFRPIDTNGEALSQSWSSSDDGETVTRTYSNDIPDDATLLIQFWSQSAETEIPFTVEGLPAKLD
ncbi:MAG: hypothetical protein H0W78_10915 [Planctomycetes bacterium]|nr:hypothetical protein [Planctomycetota bacterium]